MISKDAIILEEFQDCKDVEELQKRLKGKDIVLEPEELENLFHDIQLSKYIKIKELDLEEVFELFL